jgi:hypothetical protein
VSVANLRHWFYRGVAHACIVVADWLYFLSDRAYRRVEPLVNIELTIEPEMTGTTGDFWTGRLKITSAAPDKGAQE